MKYIFTILLFIGITLAAPVYASEETGTITTGVETGMEGMVIVEPTASPAPDTYTASVNVTLTGGAGTQSIYYTTDGATPSCSGAGTLYSGAITIASTTTIKAIACYPQSNSSSVASFAYTISSSAPSGGGGGGGGGGGITPPTACTADADFNDDGKVDIFDLSILSSNWGSTTASDTTGDANCDSVVDIFDLNILTINWTG